MKPKRYRKKPVVISAMQWDGSAEGAAPIIDWILEHGWFARYIGKGEAHGLRLTTELGKEWSDLRKEWAVAVKKDAPAFLVIKTLEGDHRADANDYIIEGVKQEHYPVKPDIFAQTYEDAEGA